MTKGVSQEGFFWDTYPWVVYENFGGSSSGGGCDEKSTNGKKLLNSSISNNHSQMKQPVMGSVGGSVGGSKEVVATTSDDGRKRNGTAFEMRNGNQRKGSIDNNEKGKGNTQSSDHIMHIRTERERRKKMKSMFSDLHALLPQLPPKVDKATMVDEAVNYVKSLQQTLKKLEKQKLERVHRVSTNITIASLNQPQKMGALDTWESFLADHCSSTSHLANVSHPSSTSLSSPQSPIIFQTWTSSNVSLNVCGLDAHINICSPKKTGLLTTICFVLEKHNIEIVSAQISSDQSKSMFMIHARVNAPQEFVEAFPYEKIYKQAATEIMLWVHSKSS